MNLLNKKRIYCNNCNRDGHVTADCVIPVTSYGVISFIINGYTEQEHKLLFADITISPDDITLRTIEGINSIPAPNVEDIAVFDRFSSMVNFVMITRKDSLGFLEFVRGHYDPMSPQSIIHLFKQMMPGEIKRISMAIREGADGFTPLAKVVALEQYKAKWQESYDKWCSMIKGKFGETDLPHDLRYYAEKIEPSHATPEIGFPAGRRQRTETSLSCAQREFEEETGLVAADYQVLNRIKPIRDEFTGTDGKRYRRNYYLAFMHRPTKLTVDEEKDGQKNEVGMVFYCDYDRAMKLIRPYHIAKQKALTLAYQFIMGRIIKLESKRRALQLGEAVDSPEEAEEKEEKTQAKIVRRL
jgi:8-oxo-dGTP pyrophosphatase MutT (NUDIX family)